MRGLPPKKSYDRHYRAIASEVTAVEHYRVEAGMNNAALAVYDHWAVVILRSGKAFVGKAIISDADFGTYSRKLGHTISVGRALHAANTRPNAAFFVPLTDSSDPKVINRFCRAQLDPAIRTVLADRVRM